MMIDPPDKAPGSLPKPKRRRWLDWQPSVPMYSTASYPVTSSLMTYMPTSGMIYSGPALDAQKEREREQEEIRKQRDAEFEETMKIRRNGGNRQIEL